METTVIVINTVLTLFAEKLQFTSASDGGLSGDAAWFHCEHILPQRGQFSWQQRVDVGCICPSAAGSWKLFEQQDAHET